MAPSPGNVAKTEEPALNPIDQIRAQYLAKPEDRPFEWFLDWHLNHGFVHSTPSFFIMGLRVSKEGLDLGQSPIDAYRPKDGDCWLVFAMAGDLAKAWQVLPEELPYIAWHRDRDGGKDLHIHPLSQIRRISGGIQATTGGQ